jgi:hypothetical protein
MKRLSLVLLLFISTLKAEENDLALDTFLAALGGGAIGTLCGGWVGAIAGAGGQAYMVYDSESNTTSTDIYDHPTIDVDEFNKRYKK